MIVPVDPALIGRHTYGTEHIKLHLFDVTDGRLQIGSFCSIGGNIEIYLGGNHRTDFCTTYPFGMINQDVFPSYDGNDVTRSRGNVVIQNDVWIASNVRIMSGVIIGTGAVVCNGAVVSRNVMPYSVVFGNPAQHIRFRFSDSIIAKLLKLRWWDLPDEEINKIAPTLCSRPTEELLDKLLETYR
jgi:acetyltransferase-like isoleucine patch superfamily enzyme